MYYTDFLNMNRLVGKPTMWFPNRSDTAKLICVFVFAYADCWFSHEAAQLYVSNDKNSNILTVIAVFESIPPLLDPLLNGIIDLCTKTKFEQYSLILMANSENMKSHSHFQSNC